MECKDRSANPSKTLVTSVCFNHDEATCVRVEDRTVSMECKDRRSWQTFGIISVTSMFQSHGAPCVWLNDKVAVWNAKTGDLMQTLRA